MILDPEQLRYEMSLRGSTGEHLAKAAGVNQGTIGRALRRQPVHPTTVQRITSAILAAPLLQMAETLVAKPAAAVKSGRIDVAPDGYPGGLGQEGGGR